MVNRNAKLWNCYLITNKVNNRKYVGITSNDVMSRWGRHISAVYSDWFKDNPNASELYRDILEFGVDQFEIKLLESNVSLEDRDSIERKYIELHSSFIDVGGYNKTTGGFSGFHISETTKHRIGTSNSKVLSGKSLSDEHKQNISKSLSGEGNPNFGRPMSQAQKDAISKSLRGENNPNWGKPRDEATRSKISASMVGVPHTEERKRNIRAARQKNSRVIYMYDKYMNLLQEFTASFQAAEYVVALNLSKSNLGSVRDEITSAARKEIMRYGFNWSYLKRSDLM